jgi:hypothetical protein
MHQSNPVYVHTHTKLQYTKSVMVILDVKNYIALIDRVDS